MKKLLSIILLLLSFSVIAGGSQFELEVIDFKQMNDGSHELTFNQLTDPYNADENIKPVTKHVLIKYGCSQMLACFTTKRTFTKQQHIEAIAKLKEIAKPGKIILLGVMSEGFIPIKNKDGYYRAYGSFLVDGKVFLYANSHL
jgi:hypothetical protein